MAEVNELLVVMRGGRVFWGGITVVTASVSYSGTRAGPIQGA